VIFHPVDGVVPKRLFGEEVFIKRIVAVEGDTVEVIHPELILFKTNWIGQEQVVDRQWGKEG